MGPNRNLALGAMITAMVLSVSAVYAASRCEVVSIRASKAGKGSDPKTARFSALFKNKPFSDFDTFELVDTQHLSVEIAAPVSLKLPDGISGSLRLNKIDAGKFDLTVTLGRGGKSPVRIQGIAAPGSPILAAGMKNDSGIWIFGITCAHTAGGIAY